ncbi:MAG TPA: lipid II flippase MurJ [Bacilli bacterium]
MALHKQTRRNYGLLFRNPVAALTVINVGVALLAFVKDVALAAYAGTSLQADALTLAYFVPDSIGNNLFAAAISVVCIPVFSEMLANNRLKRLRVTVRQLFVCFIGISFIIMAFIFSFPGLLSDLLNQSPDAELTRLIAQLLRLFLPTVAMFVCVAVGTAILQALRQFIAPAVAPLFINLCFLAGVLYCRVADIPLAEGVRYIAFFITGGVFLVGLWIARTGIGSLAKVAAVNRKKGVAETHGQHTEWRGMMRMLLLYLAILLSMQAVFFAERYMITTFASGAAAALNYAYRLTQFPVWVFVAAVSVVILPDLSRHIALNEREQAKRLLKRAFRAVVLIVFPAMAFLFLLREPVTIGLFQHGAFDDRSVQLTSGILAGYSLSVLSQSISLISLRFFLAEKNLIAALLAYAVSALVTISGDFAFTRLLGPPGVGYGAAIGAAVNAALMLTLMSRSLRPRFAEVRRELAKLGRAAAFPAIYFLLMRALWFLLPAHHSLFALVYVLLGGFMFLTGYLVLLFGQWPDLLRSLKIQYGKDESICQRR